MQYLNKDLHDYTLEQLKNILAQYNDAMAKREEASKHDKFTKGVGNKKAMPFPPPNPMAIELIKALEEEIKNR